MVREVFIDEWVIAAFKCWIMNSLILWSTVRIRKKSIRLCRILLAGFVGGLYYFWFRYRFELGPLGKIEILYFIGTSVLMVLIGAKQRSVTDYFKTLRLFYLLTILTVAVSSVVYFLVPYYSNRHLTHWETIFVNFLALLLVAELGWGLVHQLLWEKSCQISLRLSLLGKTIDLSALLDSGNLLVDPLTKHPVIMVEVNSVKEILPEEVQKLSETILSGELPTEKDLELDAEWAVRIRFLSYTSVGREKGFLLGIRPDEVLILQKKPRKLPRALIGLYHLSSSSHQTYQALLPTSLLTAICD